MGDEKGMEYLKKLATQQIVNVPANVVLDQVMSGEYAITLMSYSHHSVMSTAKGAHLQWLRIDPAMMLVVRLHHQGRAASERREALLDFILSVDGQTVLANADYLPAHPKVPAKVAELKPEGGGFKAYEIPAAAFDRDQEKWNKVFADLFR